MATREKKMPVVDDSSRGRRPYWSAWGHRQAEREQAGKASRSGELKALVPHGCERRPIAACATATPTTPPPTAALAGEGSGVLLTLKVETKVKSVLTAPTRMVSWNCCVRLVNPADARVSARRRGGPGGKRGCQHGGSEDHMRSMAVI